MQALVSTTYEFVDEDLVDQFGLAGAGMNDSFEGRGDTSGDEEFDAFDLAVLILPIKSDIAYGI